MFLDTLEFWSKEGSKEGLELGTLGGGWELDFGLQIQGSFPSFPPHFPPKIRCTFQKETQKDPHNKKDKRNYSILRVSNKLECNQWMSDYVTTYFASFKPQKWGKKE